MNISVRPLFGFRRLSILVLGGILFVTPAQVGALDGKIVARINGQPVYDWEITMAENEIDEDLAQVKPDMRLGLLLRYVVDTRLMALAGTSAGMDKEEGFKRRAYYNGNQAMRDTYFEKKVLRRMGDKELRAIFDVEIKKFKPVEEVRVRHILVKNEEDALDIVERLNRGDEFSSLAKEKSLDPSGQNGGDLGYFRKGQMDKSFEVAAFTLSSGEISSPVKSSSGWHLIKLEDKRMTKAPVFDDLKDRIKAQLVQQKSRQVISDLRKGANVEVLDKELASRFSAIE